VILFDTSAILALANPRDAHHEEAVRTLRAIEEDGRALLLHSYVLLESFALVHRRFGLADARRIDDQLDALLTVVVDRPLHARGVAWLRTSPHVKASLVDAVSFVVMEDRGIDDAFAFDPDFEAAGFRLFRASR
jgi:predicted nucleic acid-binding protein